MKIEKLVWINSESQMANIINEKALQLKINEIIYELNHILEERESGIKVYEEVMPNMKPADPFAEQRKWIGKMCWFWNNDTEDDKFAGVLNRIDEYTAYAYVQQGIWFGYKHCEPVKQYEDMIYKGE